MLYDKPGILSDVGFLRENQNWHLPVVPGALKPMQKVRALIAKNRTLVGRCREYNIPAAPAVRYGLDRRAPVAKSHPTEGASLSDRRGFEDTLETCEENGQGPDGPAKLPLELLNDGQEIVAGHPLPAHFRGDLVPPAQVVGEMVPGEPQQFGELPGGLAAAGLLRPTPGVRSESPGLRQGQVPGRAGCSRRGCSRCRPPLRCWPAGIPGSRRHR